MAETAALSSYCFLYAYEKTGRRGAKACAQDALLDPALRDLARGALGQALGPPVSDSSPFPCMIWYGGARDVEATAWSRGGHRFTGTTSDFVEHVLFARSREVAEKRCGWVVEPVSNRDGRRTNDSTTCMHALFLDCDGAGTWDALLDALEDFAHIAYESGGATPAVPKWRLVLPLASPFSVRDDAEGAAWKRAYHSCRVVFGALGGLLGPGFDPATDTPAAPWFVTERRRAEDPPRRVLWRPGASLDLPALLRRLPEIPPEPEALYSGGCRPESTSVDLEEIVSALAKATCKVPRERRSLYLSLPGALLDRGVPPDDVRTICEDVSARYPRPDAEKHRDNCHSAETTIAKWERGEPVTQIGTLNDLWPEVAKVLDRLLPDPLLEETRAAVERLRAAPKKAPGGTILPSSGQFLEGPHRRRLGALALKKLKSPQIDAQIRGVMLHALLKGEDLVPRMPTGEPASLDGKVVTRQRAIAVVMGMVAFKLPVETPFDAGLSEIARKSLHAMLKEGERVRDLMEEAERAFLRALGKKMKADEKRAQEIAEMCARARDYAFHGRPR